MTHLEKRITKLIVLIIVVIGTLLTFNIYVQAKENQAEAETKLAIATNESIAYYDNLRADEWAKIEEQKKIEAEKAELARQKALAEAKAAENSEYQVLNDNTCGSGGTIIYMDGKYVNEVVNNSSKYVVDEKTGVYQEKSTGAYLIAMGPHYQGHSYYEITLTNGKTFPAKAVGWMSNTENNCKSKSSQGMVELIADTSHGSFSNWKFMGNSNQVKVYVQSIKNIKY